MTHCSYRVEHCISADHPSLAGHFPQQPVVPGVVLLDRVLATLRDCSGHYRLLALPVVKFSAPLLPDEPFVIELQRDADGQRVRFDCFRDAKSFATGHMKLVKDD